MSFLIFWIVCGLITTYVTARENGGDISGECVYAAMITAGGCISFGIMMWIVYDLYWSDSFVDDHDDHVDQ